MSCACHPSEPICPDTSDVMEVTTKAQLAACFDIRRAVFIEEQNIPETEEWDDKDLLSHHFLVADPHGPVGTARAYVDGDEVRIGRVAVLPRGRGAGFGRKLMSAVLVHAGRSGHRRVCLDAQVTALKFYENLGFVAEGVEFDDGSGILHRRMTRMI
ncbi:MAG: GNAT family N-acetyltransferase [Pseudomonadota bacterium]